MCMVGAVVCLLLSEDGATVMREHLEALVCACDGHPPLSDLSTLFGDSDCITLEQFETWIMSNADLASFTEWLLGDGTSECGQGLQLEAEPDPPTFYQTLSERFQCEKTREKE